MRTEIAAFLSAAAVCAMVVPLVRRFARRRGLFDDALSSRKMHAARVPRLGGVAIVAGFYAPLFALMLYPTGVGAIFYADSQLAFAFIVGGLAIASLGIFDDLFGAGAKGKFAVQFAVACYVWSAGFRVEHLQLPTGTVIQLGIFGAALTIVWIVGVMNAINLVDGLDGLAGGIALVAALTNFFVASAHGSPLMALCMAALAGSLVAFLVFNFNPASIFMGDGGSLFLGYVLAVSSVRTSQKSTAALSLLVPLVVLALPICDTLLAMLRRGVRGRPMFSGDKEHIHHRLLALGLSHRGVVLVLYAVSGALGLGALGMSFLPSELGLSAICALAVVGTFGLYRLGFFDFERGEVLERRKRNTALRATVRSIRSALRSAASLDEVLDSLARLGPAMEADRVRLKLKGHAAELSVGGPSPRDPSCNGAHMPGGISVTPWRVPRLVLAHPPMRARFALEAGFGHLEVEWSDGRREIDRDHEIAAEDVCKVMTLALERTMVPGQGGERPDR
jgi:UDP-GlcNAc:undecaprenyl-phosphate GlcNAc-1-phosphate transferase